MNKTPAIIVAIIAIIVLCCCSLCALLWTAYSLQRAHDLYPHDAVYQGGEPLERVIGSAPGLSSDGTEAVEADGAE
jgi:hypothetical protein